MYAGYTWLLPLLEGGCVSKGVAQVPWIRNLRTTPVFSLNLTPIHSLRHRLVRSRQYAEGVVLGLLRF